MKLLHALLGLALLALSGCSNLGYYWQSASGHIAVLGAAAPVDELLHNPQTPHRLKERLALSQKIRAYASDVLKLPNNASYTRYSDLKRNAVVWNVVAAPSTSLQLKTWCFAFAGCVGYQGHYNEADAKAFAESLKAGGYEVSVYGVPAYSTLGKLWFLGDYGADPLLNTFINYPDGELARLVFHELAHQVLYVPDDTVFNESFATAVERIGGRMWLDAHATPQARAAFDLRDHRQREFRALTAKTRERLQTVFSTEPVTVSSQKLTANSPSVSGFITSHATKTGVLENKAKVMEQLRSEYAGLKASWGGFAGYDAWIANANNASLAAQGAYDDLVPQFEAVFDKNGRDFERFYSAIKAMVRQSKSERRAALLVASQ